MGSSPSPASRERPDQSVPVYRLSNEIGLSEHFARFCATPDFGGETYDDGDLPTGSDRALGLVDFSLFPPLEREDMMPDTSLAKIENGLPGCQPADAIDDQTAIKVVDGTVEVVSEGHWKPFTHPQPRSKLIVSGDTRARLASVRECPLTRPARMPVTPWLARLRCPEPVP